jgi:hypothetical protein
MSKENMPLSCNVVVSSYQKHLKKCVFKSMHNLCHFPRNISFKTESHLLFWFWAPSSNSLQTRNDARKQDDQERGIKWQNDQALGRAHLKTSMFNIWTFKLWVFELEWALVCLERFECEFLKHLVCKSCVS